MNDPRIRKKIAAAAIIICLIVAVFAGFMIIRSAKDTATAAAEYTAVTAEYASPDFGVQTDAEGGIRLVGAERNANVSTAGMDYDITREDEMEEAKRDSVPFKAAAEPHPDHAALLEENPDYVCWIWIPGTPISYPVVSRDDTFYTDHTFMGSESAAGCVFIGQSSDTITYIYGHNMHDLSMFGALRRAGSMDGIDTVHLMYPSGDKVYKIVSSHVTSVGGDVYLQPLSMSGLKSFMESQITESAKEYKDIPQNPSEVVVLSTCFGISGGTGRYVMVCAK